MLCGGGRGTCVPLHLILFLSVWVESKAWRVFGAGVLLYCMCAQSSYRNLFCFVLLSNYPVRIHKCRHGLRRATVVEILVSRYDGIGKSCRPGGIGLECIVYLTCTVIV